MDEITAAGLDIHQATVVKFESIMYYGAGAIRMLTRFSTRSGLLNRMSCWFFVRPLPILVGFSLSVIGEVFSYSGLLDARSHG